MPVSTDDLLTTTEIAERYRLKASTVNRWARTGILPTAQRFPGPKGRRRFRPADVEALLAPKPVEQAS